ncbi:hypothetical protein [Aerococcus viridans]|uniref:hypothetical protein n=1 Tax=Aerococcus viridans TaxID=1377 RepID=UPI003B213D54
MTKAETQIFKSGIFRFFELLKKNKRIEYALYKMGIRTGGGDFSIFWYTPKDEKNKWNSFYV